MEIKNKHVFWEALIVAILIFSSGILIGYILEMNRTNKIVTMYQESELNLLDVNVQKNLLSLNNIDCDGAIKQTIIFADRVYEEARFLDRYEDSAKLSQGLMFEHKRYDLLRTILWTNAIELKEKCGQKFKTVVYFYEYKPESLETRSLQTTFANKLSVIKEQFGNSIILIPLATNLEVNSIDYLLKVYNILETPTILIDEEIKISNIEDFKNLETYLK